MGAMPPGGNPTTSRSSSVFYKFIEQSIIEQKRLDIPRRFIEIHGDELCDVVYLTASSPGIWPVCLKKDYERVWFRGGWQKFMVDQSIHVGCFLVFKYEGHSKFHVDMYNLAASKANCPCITPFTLEEFAGGIRFRLPHKRDDLDDTVNTVDYHTFGATFNFSLKNVYDDIHRTSWGSTNDFRQSGSTTAFQAEHSPVMLQTMVMTTQDISIQVEENVVTGNITKETSRGVEYPPSIQAKPHCGKRKAIAEPEADRDGFQAEDVSIGEPCAKVSTRSSASRHNAKKAVVEAASCFKSNHPFVSVFMKPTNLSSFMYLPSWFAQKHLQGLSGNIKLYLGGNLWPVELVAGSNNRGLIRRGWLAFARDNHLEEGDICVFELVDKKDAVLKVSIYRSADYVPGAASR